jgi:hypothetical protein
MNNEEWKDGLPGVGVVCECYTTDGAGMFKWQKGEVLKCLDGECAVVVESSLLRWCDQFRPIKKREPQPGEVWATRGQFVLITTETNSMEVGYVFLDGANLHVSDVRFDDMTYAAPDVKSYIARELLKDTNHKDEFVFCVLKDAARLDEE